MSWGGEPGEVGGCRWCDFKPGLSNSIDRAMIEVGFRDADESTSCAASAEVGREA